MSTSGADTNPLVGQRLDHHGKPVPDHYKWIALSNTTLGVLIATINASILLISLPNIFEGIDMTWARAEHGAGAQKLVSALLKDFARTHNVKLIPLSIGGNNFNFGDVLTTCVTNYVASITAIRSIADPPLCSKDPSPRSVAKSAAAALTTSFSVGRRTGFDRCHLHPFG